MTDQNRKATEAFQRDPDLSSRVVQIENTLSDPNAGDEIIYTSTIDDVLRGQAITLAGFKADLVASVDQIGDNSTPYDPAVLSGIPEDVNVWTQDGTDPVSGQGLPSDTATQVLRLIVENATNPTYPESTADKTLADLVAFLYRQGPDLATEPT